MNHLEHQRHQCRAVPRPPSVPTVIDTLPAGVGSITVTLERTAVQPLSN